LCFAICSPQIKFETNKYANWKLREFDFFSKGLTLNQLIEILKSSGMRFHSNKAKQLFLARLDFAEIYDAVKCSTCSDIKKRECLVRNVKGLGMKTSSHFLRNIGDTDNLAIIDTHIAKFLKSDLPKNKKQYIAMETEFRQFAVRNLLTVRELDAFIWAYYSNNGLEYVR
jgi:N-glycosylase/DNA lyase